MKFQTGMRIGRYTLQERVGSGSSGEIWKATDSTKTVAIKFIHGELLTSASSEKHRHRLEREIRALQVLNHPNIPALFDYDLHFERPYIVMEFVDSASLDTLIFNRQIIRYPLGTRMKIIRDIASALRLAHQNGIIHRDIKPGNINGVEHPYLMDFGIALQEQASLKTNINIGTTIYMAPEMEPPNILSDSWSFAVVAYEILFGFHPIFNYDDPLIPQGLIVRFETKNRLDSGQWRKPSKLSSSRLPEDLQHANLTRLDLVFSRALGKPEGRYQDVLAFVDDLERSLPLDERPLTLEDVAASVSPSASMRDVQEMALFTQIEVEQAQRGQRIILIGIVILAVIVILMIVAFIFFT